ncbi:NB-ARC domains-containing protein [Tanacetum coccineum]
MIWLHYRKVTESWEEAKKFVTFCFHENHVELKECGVRFVSDDDLEQDDTNLSMLLDLSALSQHGGSICLSMARGKFIWSCFFLSAYRMSSEEKKRWTSPEIKRNWRPFFLIIHHDISNEIPVNAQKLSQPNGAMAPSPVNKPLMGVVPKLPAGFPPLGAHGPFQPAPAALPSSLVGWMANLFESMFINNISNGIFKMLHDGPLNAGKILKTKDLKISSVGEGTMVIKQRMACKRVLLVLDDVNSVEHLEALAGSPDWFYPGSLIIFTSKDKQLLRVSPNKKKGKSKSTNGGQFGGYPVKQTVKYEPKTTTSASKKGTTNVGNASKSSTMLKTTVTSTMHDNIHVSNPYMLWMRKVKKR